MSKVAVKELAINIFSSQDLGKKVIAAEFKSHIILLVRNRSKL